MRFHLSTDDLPARRRFDVWRDMIAGLIGVVAERPDDGAQPFQARLSMRSNAPLVRMDVRSGTHRMARTRSAIARRRWDCYSIYMEGSAGARIGFAGREILTGAGDIVMFDTDAPFETCAADGYDHGVWLLPKPLLDPYLQSGRLPLSLSQTGRSGVDALAAGFLAALTDNWDTLAGPTVGPVVDTLCRLIGLVGGAVAPAQAEAVRQGRLVEAKRTIERHLASPDLSPGSVAAGLGISVRALHMLFEPTDTTFARYVLRRRLDECRAALLGNPARPVIDVAFAWGFSSLSSFYRAFQGAFGVSPGDARAAARVTWRS